MKASKIKSCGPCSYRGHKADVCTLLMEDGYPVDITEQIEKQTIHPDCKLADWPEVSMEEIEKMIMMRWGISEEANGNKKWLLDILKSTNVIIKERQNKCPKQP